MFAGLLNRVLDRTVQGGDALLRACGRALREPERAGFLVASGVHLGATALGATRLRSITKPLLMPLLVGSVLRSERSYAEQAVACLGLAAATTGDVLLLSDHVRGLPRGAGAFAVSQLAWSALLWRRGARASISRALLRAVPWAFAVSLTAQRQPRLLPVAVGYGGLLATTSTLADDPALHRGGVEAPGIGHGGNLFLISDALILLRALTAGGRPVDTVVMATYLIAQLLIVDGLMRAGS